MIRPGANASPFVACLMAGGVLGLAMVGNGQETVGRSNTSWPGAELFAPGVIRQFQIEIAPEAVTSLRGKARDYVSATVIEGATIYTNVGIHLKGATGSFRALDDKPSLTLDFSRFQKGRKFHGLRKIHLNNSVEDPSYVNEIIGSEMFRAVGVPTPRATRSLVMLNGRACGLYVLKEGFTEDFLACHFQHIGDELYEPENGGDVDAPMKRNSVLAPAGNGIALKTLTQAALESEPTQRWQCITKALDTDRFLTFMSLEIMLGHRDGYCLARNNFRVYHDLDTGKAVFFPHGMDQLFGTADLPWQPSLGGLVANAVMTTSEGKKRYANRFSALLTNAFNVGNLTNRVNQLVLELRPILSGNEWSRVRDAAAVVNERMVQRRLSLVSQLSQPPGKPLEFSGGPEPLKGWKAAVVTGRGKIDEAKSPDGRAALHIVAAGEMAAAWSAKALIPRGHYRFEGRVRIANVQPLPYGVHHGAGLRVRGSIRQTDSFTGDSAWQLLGADFQVEPAAEEVEFLCELRAREGEAWFELDSLRILPLRDL